MWCFSRKDDAKSPLVLSENDSSSSSSSSSESSSDTGSSDSESDSEDEQEAIVQHPIATTSPVQAGSPEDKQPSEEQCEMDGLQEMQTEGPTQRLTTQSLDMVSRT